MKTVAFMVLFVILTGRNMLTDRIKAFNSSVATLTIENKFSTTDTSINGEWFLQPVVPSDTATGKIPVIVFDLAKNTFSGNNGCNSMNGKFTIKKNALSFDEKIATTRMACTGYNEQGFMKNLLKTNRYKIEGGLLILMSGTTELSRWTRKIQPEIRAKA